MRTRTLFFSASILVGSFLIPIGASFAQTDVNRAADNSAINQRDRGHKNFTPIDQSNKPSDLKMTREIRRAIIKDRQLSTDAKNIKIITIDGAVTLRGPVKSDHEKADIAAKAAQLAGGVTAGVLGWLVGIGTLAIPGVGPLIAAGPIMAALSGAAAGGAVGSLAGALVGLGIPEFEAKQYEGKVKNGNILISVHTEDSKERNAAKEIFDRAHADDVSYTGEARV